MVTGEHLKDVNTRLLVCECTVAAAAGDHTIDISVRDKSVDGSPFICMVYDNDQIIISNMPDRTVLGKPVSFNSKSPFRLSPYHCRHIRPFVTADALFFLSLFFLFHFPPKYMPAFSGPVEARNFKFGT